MEFIEYSKCTTCKRAKKFLNDKNINYTDREVKDNCPTIKEINNWIKKYNIDINKLFNTSGILYREYKLKDKLKTMNDDEKIELLSKNPMLVKRPLLILKDKLLIGFKEEEWNKIDKEV